MKHRRRRVEAERPFIRDPSKVATDRTGRPLLCLPSSCSGLPLGDALVREFLAAIEQARAKD